MEIKMKRYDMGEYFVIFSKNVNEEKITFYLTKRKYAKHLVKRWKREMFRIYGYGKVMRRPKYFASRFR
jgi:hypothetical protein